MGVQKDPNCDFSPFEIAGSLTNYVCVALFILKLQAAMLKVEHCFI